MIFLIPFVNIKISSIKEEHRFSTCPSWLSAPLSHPLWPLRHFGGLPRMYRHRIGGCGRRTFLAHFLLRFWIHQCTFHPLILRFPVLKTCRFRIIPCIQPHPPPISRSAFPLFSSRLKRSLQKDNLAQFQLPIHQEGYPWTPLHRSPDPRHTFLSRWLFRPRFTLRSSLRQHKWPLLFPIAYSQQKWRKLRFNRVRHKLLVHWPSHSVLRYQYSPLSRIQRSVVQLICLQHFALGVFLVNRIWKKAKLFDFGFSFLGEIDLLFEWLGKIRPRVMMSSLKIIFFLCFLERANHEGEVIEARLLDSSSATVISHGYLNK